MVIKKSGIQIDDIPIEVIYKRIKNINLIVFPPYGNVRISAPAGTSLEVVRSFAVSKIAWIKKHRLKYITAKQQFYDLYNEHENYYHLGRLYSLKTFINNGKTKVNLTDNTIELYVKKDIPQRKKLSLLNEWSRLQLKNLIPQFIKKWETRMDVSVTGFGIKKMKTRWGSCNTRTKRIWLNLELAKRPIYCLEYIVVHEMVHLLEKKHNYRFKKYMDEFLPGWREYKHELQHFPVSTDLPYK